MATARTCVATMTTTILCWQTNVGRSRAASTQLLVDLTQTERTNPSLIALVQEPHLDSEGKVGKFHSHKVWCHETARPRACVIAGPSVSGYPLSQFITRDVAAGIINTGTKEVCVVSVYCDINLDFPPTLFRLLGFAERRKLEVVIGLDSNAHSPIWGSQDTNKRGEKLEEIIFNHRLAVLNKGTKPTFLTSRAQSVIDVTLATGSLLQEITDWKVSDADTLSDHRRLSFQIQISSPQPVKLVRKLAKGDWPLFRQVLEAREWTEPQVWTAQVVEEETRSLLADIREGLDAACPLVPVKPGKIRWWNNDLAEMKHRCQLLFRVARKPTSSQEDWQAYKEQARQYYRAIRLAKRESYRLYVETMDGPRKTASLVRSLKGATYREVGQLKAEDRTTQSPVEALEVLFREHFPGSYVRKRRVRKPKAVCTNPNIPWITGIRVTEAIRTFQPNKAPGPDGLKPLILQQLGRVIANRVARLFTAMITLGYTPEIWRLAKVIFIPKSGKDDYQDARAFRPISLTSFFLKALERIIYWHLEEGLLREFPLHRNQHAFRKGHSTETAVTDLLDEVESVVLRGKQALGVFLDIKGAFDNVTPDLVVKELKARGVGYHLGEWLAAYLRGRSATAELHGSSYQCKLVYGTPQGGVLSPLLWNLAFDGLLRKFDRGPVRAIGYADDAALLIKGIDLPTMSSIMQEALQTAEKWSKRAHLSFSPQKSVVVFFTRKRRPPVLPQLRLGGQTLQRVDQVKYLGIVLDQRLSWTPHIDQKIAKAKRLLMTLLSGMGRLWGPKPKVTRWMYTGIVIPAITYGALAWGGNITEAQAGRLASLNRLAARLIAPFRDRTPTAGLEVILNLAPLPLLIEKEALKGYLRTQSHIPVRWTGLGSSQKGHRQKWSAMVSTLNLPEVDTEMLSLNWTRNYTVDLEDTNIVSPQDQLAVCYTDGSAMDGGTGWGFVVLTSNTGFRYCGALLPENSVYQAELRAIYKATLFLKELGVASVMIYSDSRAALLALARYHSESWVEKACKSGLNDLGHTSRVCLRWVKAHQGTLGNEEADMLAKEGTQLGTDFQETLPLPKSYLSKILSTRLIQKWNESWQRRPDCLQTKDWFPRVQVGLSKKALRLSRLWLGVLIQLVTGFNGLRRHEAKIDGGTNTCRLCEEEVESSRHIISECPVLGRWRLENLGYAQVSSIDPLPSWTPQQILRSLQDPCMEFFWGSLGID